MDVVKKGKVKYDLVPEVFQGRAQVVMYKGVVTFAGRSFEIIHYRASHLEMAAQVDRQCTRGWERRCPPSSFQEPFKDEMYMGGRTSLPHGSGCSAAISDLYPTLSCTVL